MAPSRESVEQQATSPAILLVEDEPGIVDFVRRGLRGQNTVGTLCVGDIEVDLLTREVRRGAELVRLSTTEFELLVYLLRHRGHVLSRERILSAVWGYEHDPNTNIVDVYIGYLRRKLKRHSDPAPIFTVRTVGYRLGDGA